MRLLFEQSRKGMSHAATEKKRKKMRGNKYCKI